MISLLNSTRTALEARSRLVVTTSPVVEPLTVSELKQHLRIEHNDEDSLLAGYIKAAREIIEVDIERALITQTVKLYLPAFCAHEIQLRRPPVQSVTSIQYYDTARTLQTLSTAYYTLDAISEPARVYENYGYQWPSTGDIENAVIVTFVAGYGDPDDVPQVIKQALALIVRGWVENCNTGGINPEVVQPYQSLLSRVRWNGGV